jgi:hypothetical protein
LSDLIASARAKDEHHIAVHAVLAYKNSTYQRRAKNFGEVMGRWQTYVFGDADLGERMGSAVNETVGAVANKAIANNGVLDITNLLVRTVFPFWKEAPFYSRSVEIDTINEVPELRAFWDQTRDKLGIREFDPFERDILYGSDEHAKGLLNKMMNNAYRAMLRPIDEAIVQGDCGDAKIGELLLSTETTETVGV